MSGPGLRAAATLRRKSSSGRKETTYARFDGAGGMGAQFLVPAGGLISAKPQGLLSR
jgi:hypothetical protein